jgi:hypothetical protein
MLKATIKNTPRDFQPIGRMVNWNPTLARPQNDVVPEVASRGSAGFRRVIEVAGMGFIR